MMKLNVVVAITGMAVWASSVSYVRAAIKTNAPPRVLCIWGSSHGSRVIIQVDGKTILDKIITGNPDVSPDVDCLDLKSNTKKRSVMEISGDRYKAKYRIEWTKGPRLMIGFQPTGKVDINQDDGKARFE